MNMVIISCLVASGAAFGLGAVIGYACGFARGEDCEAVRRERVAAEQESARESVEGFPRFRG